MKRINNLEDLRYRKLFLRSEIIIKEQKITDQIHAMHAELQTANFKNEILQLAVNNPVMVINIARIAYDLLTRYRRFRRKRARRS